MCRAQAVVLLAFVTQGHTQEPAVNRPTEALVDALVDDMVWTAWAVRPNLASSAVHNAPAIARSRPGNVLRMPWLSSKESWWRRRLATSNFFMRHWQKSLCRLRGCVPMRSTSASAAVDSDRHGVKHAQWDVLGLGQAIVDFSATVSDEFLQDVQVPKGGRRVITVEERSKVLSDLDGSSYTVNVGGSLSNSLVALARMGLAKAELDQGFAPLRVALSGPIGSDPLGAFYKAEIEKAGVDFIAQPQANSSTGTVMVLTTPDAQRSFLSYPGTAHDLLKDAAASAASRCRVLVIEGYLWEMPGAWEGIRHAILKAQENNALIAMTAGDVGVVQRHREDMLKALHMGVDVMFTNGLEASALTDTDPENAEESAIRLASHARLGVVTIGSRGAYIAYDGRAQHLEPHWAADKPVDTNGAGDAYAAGVLYGLLNDFGKDDVGIARMGNLGARVASTVISRYGAVLQDSDALKLIQELPHDFHGGLEERRIAPMLMQRPHPLFPSAAFHEMNATSAELNGRSLLHG